jgi:EAL domain-containing protein (putative c-di-GMP-specific phosphodiesterase class I)
MAGGPPAAALVRSTIDLTHSLGLRMVAEGVEDRQTWDALRRYGCDAVQGFYLTPAVPADVVIAWLDDRAAAPR